MLALVRRFAGALPPSVQHEVRRYRFRRQIRQRIFRLDEPEFDRLTNWVHEGDWVIDVGANVGHYTLRLSELVGPTGRVIAFEPVPTTFALLAANSQIAPYPNITLVNAAVSKNVAESAIEVPPWNDSRLPNFYAAHLTSAAGSGGFQVLTLAVDVLNLPHRVSCVKVDAEGHELEVLQGMTRLLRRDKPVVVTEGRRGTPLLEELGYQVISLAGSPNCVATFPGN